MTPLVRRLIVSLAVIGSYGNFLVCRGQEDRRSCQKNSRKKLIYAEKAGRVKILQATRYKRLKISDCEWRICNGKNGRCNMVRVIDFQVPTLMFE